MNDDEVKAVAEALREYVAITPAEARLVAEAAISKLDEMRGDGWRPIESVPNELKRDGKLVDLWVLDSLNVGERVPDCFWKTPWGSHDALTVGWYGQPENADRRLFIEPSWRVTHWRNLPTPPTQGSET